LIAGLPLIAFAPVHFLLARFAPKPVFAPKAV
jgi:hypothetical protein